MGKKGWQNIFGKKKKKKLRMQCAHTHRGRSHHLRDVKQA